MTGSEIDLKVHRLDHKTHPLLKNEILETTKKLVKYIPNEDRVFLTGYIRGLQTGQKLLQEAGDLD